MSLFSILALLAAAQSAPVAVQTTIATQANPATPAPAVTPDTPDADPRIGQALDLISGGKPLDALPILAKVIADNEQAHPPVKDTTYFSARSMTETVLYSGLSASQHRNSVVFDGDWGLAYFLTGFALIDAGRSPEAITWFDKAVALSPMNAQYLSERAEWYKAKRDWERAYDGFESANSAAEFSDEEDKPAEKARALRGMAFVRVEQGKAGEAKKLLNDALKLVPGDPKVLRELDYIKSLGGNRS